jgi:hypothetical protein
VICCDIGRTGEWGKPLDRANVDNWPNYFLTPWQRLLSRNELPDLIYIDGRFRVACALHSLLMLRLKKRRVFPKKTKIMIHDFSGRPFYKKVTEFASVVASVNTLAVIEQNKDVSIISLLQELLHYQFDMR